ncbi:MAG: hypothetical protein JNM70_09280 [Anaerolineae bacterium]|nr:hypothetical protein [Anaerolineae bacterium]
MHLKPDAPIDLQLHTVYSDGTWTPDGLIDHLLREGFGAAAITDHERVDIVPALQALARAKGFLLLPAVEMTTRWGEAWVDMLCFGFDPQASPLRALADDVLRRQQDNIRQTVQGIAQQGVVLDEGAVQAILDEPAVRQPHSLVRLAEQMPHEGGERAIRRLLLGAGLEVVATETAVVVDAAHRSGGVCLIAHPGRGDGYLCFDEPLLDQLRGEVPIDGFEVDYPAHTREQAARFRAYAERHDLLTSAGSDSHTPDNPPVKYRADSCRKLLARLGIHVT